MEKPMGCNTMLRCLARAVSFYKKLLSGPQNTATVNGRNIIISDNRRLPEVYGADGGNYTEKKLHRFIFATTLSNLYILN